MDEHTRKKITIIGAGLGGCFLSVMLAKRGYTVSVYEKFSEKEIMNSYSSARSYNLTFYDYAVESFKKAGVWDEIEPTTVKLIGSVTQITNNPPRFIKDKPYYAVKRDVLLKTLINNAKTLKTVTFHFGQPLIAIDRQAKTIIVQNVDDKKYTTVPCEVIFGADGANSLVRTLLQQGQETSHIQEYADFEYKQIHVTKENAQKLSLKTNLMYAWTRKETLILAHPNFDASFSALLILPKNKEKGFSHLKNETAINEFFTKNYTDFLPMLPDVTRDLLTNPVSRFVTIYTTPWYYKDFMCVLGDSAHGFNPFYGQGVSAAIADCMTIIKLIDEEGPNWKRIFPKYQQQRKKHTDALADLSKQSIMQYLRYKKADYQAIYNKLDVMLFSLFSKHYNPPPYVLIAKNPLLTGDYLEKHLLQRKRMKYVGMPIAVSLITALVGVQEKISSYLNKKTKSN